MPNGKNHNFVIQTRQKDDELFRLDSAGKNPVEIAPAGSFESAIRRVVGYGAIRFLVVSSEVMVLRIEEAPTPSGPWVETSRLTAVASASDPSQFFICADIAPCGAFMRIFLDNSGAGSIFPDLIGFGHPVAGGGGSTSGGGGTGSVVELKDGNSGTTRASVKLDGVAIGAQGSVLVGGRDPGGNQVALAVNSSGQLIVSIGPNTPGATITSPADTAVGMAATVSLPTPPVGTTRMTIEVTDGDQDTTKIRVREVGGTAGAGRQLLLNGSTMFGGEGGAIAPLEVENVAGPAAAVSISFEGP